VKAYVTSVGELTTDLCIWALERNGFHVELIYNETSSLAEKLQVIYERATDTFLRVDADVIVNRNCTPNLKGVNWWTQYMTFDWYKQDRTHGGVQLIGKECISILREKIKDYLREDIDRVESQLYRCEELDYPRRCSSVPIIMGITNYKRLDVDYIKQVKERRGQLNDYDWELTERLNQL